MQRLIIWESVFERWKNKTFKLQTTLKYKFSCYRHDFKYIPF